MAEDRKYRILIAEDDADIISLLKLYLDNAGYEITACTDGISAWHSFQHQEPDLCLFDIMMPGMNGYELVQKVRAVSSVPILILSAKNADSEKILGLQLGADDYIAKPFNPLEVTARVQAALRRRYQFQDGNDTASILKVGDLVLDTDRFILTKKGKNILLTPLEMKILAYLMRSPGRVYTKLQISESIHGDYLEADDNSLMVHISKIREKIEDDPHNPVYLKTVRGIGYKIDNPKKL